MQDFFETFFSYFFALFFNVFQYFQGFAGHRVAHDGRRFPFRQNRSTGSGFSSFSGTIYGAPSRFYFLPQQTHKRFVFFLQLHAQAALLKVLATPAIKNRRGLSACLSQLFIQPFALHAVLITGSYRPVSLLHLSRAQGTD